MAGAPAVASDAAPLPWRFLGRVGHAVAAEAMEAARARVFEGDAGELLLAEHDPVITLGRSANEANVVALPDELRRRGVAVVRASRGGDVTYHGPGQLMVYPVVRLARGVVAHLEQLAGALAALAGELGAPGAVFRRAPAGLWLGDRKLAACGLHVRRGVAIHGFALDVATPPEAWRAIVPCGLAGAAVVSIAVASGHPPPSLALLAPRAAELVAAALGRRAIAAP